MYTIEIANKTYKILDKNGRTVIYQPIDPCTSSPFVSDEACLAHGEKILKNFNAPFAIQQEPPSQDI